MRPNLSLKHFDQEWVITCRSTEPADRMTAEAGVQLAYASAGLAPPKIMWCPSPIEGIRRAEKFAGNSKKVILWSPRDKYQAPFELCKLIANYLWPAVCQHLVKEKTDEIVELSALAVRKVIASSLMPNGWTIRPIINPDILHGTGLEEPARQWMKDWASHYDDIVAVTDGKIDTLFPPDGKVENIDLHDRFTKLIQSYTGFIWTNCSSTSDSFRLSWHNIGDVISAGIREEMEVECAPSFDCRHDPFNWVLYEYLAHVWVVSDLPCKRPFHVISFFNILKKENGPGTGWQTGLAPVSKFWMAWSIFSRRCARPDKAAWRPPRRWESGPGF